VPKIVTTRLPDALLDHPYFLTLAVNGGAEPYVWKLLGNAARGLQLDATSGVISGIPKSIERSQFTVEVVDAHKISDRKEFALDIRSLGEQPVPVATRIRMSAGVITLPDAVRNRPYEFQLTADGGTPPYRWSLSFGQLDPGLEVTGSGKLVGTPNNKGDGWNFRVTATDAAGAKLDQDVLLSVRAPAESLSQRLLRWTHNVVVWIGYLSVVQLLILILFGSGPTPGSPGVFGWLMGKMRQPG